ncbi:MAG: redoxin domain-containing protein [Verrucomicrobiota bacterium]|jgi:outer membrane protein assembly factor BamD (BamD/ComL family)/peroxiredoxin|nr:redoxin domain-containing protein [Verrucomicrobiota bacterium]MDD8049846.1 redoxin domain-containing protein [Verrucomicrobiota bacterium]MDI9385221.1 redoxin domain-containing protein [Verrucomicrobiota bacterium]
MCRLRALCLSFLVTGLIWSAFAQRPGSDEAAMFLGAQTLQANRQYQAAAELFQEFVVAFPESERVPEAMTERAQSLFFLGRSLQIVHRNPPEAHAAFRAAAEGFQAVADRFPGGAYAARAQYMAGSSWYFDHDLAQAESGYRLASIQHPEAREYTQKALLRLGETLLHQYRTAAAVEAFEEFRGRFPEASVEGDPLGGRVLRYLESVESLDQPAPELQVESWIQGGPLRLSEVRGRPVILYFFATWCPHCNSEREFIKYLWHRYVPEGYVFIGVTNRSRGQTPQSVGAYLQQHAMGFPVAMDSAGQTAEAFHGTTVPRMVLIDDRGIVRWRDHPGSLVEEMLGDVKQGR